MKDTIEDFLKQKQVEKVLGKSKDISKKMLGCAYDYPCTDLEFLLSSMACVVAAAYTLELTTNNLRVLINELIFENYETFSNFWDGNKKK